MISKNFIKVSFLYTLVGALPMASAVILLPLYVYYLPSELYGILSISLAFSILIQIIVTYSFDTSLYVHYHELKGEPERLSVFVSASFIFMLLIGVSVIFFLLATGQIIFNLLPDKSISFYPYGLISVIIGIFQALFKVHGNFLQTRENSTTHTWSNLVLFSLIVLFTVIGFKIYPGTLAGPLGGRLFAGLIMAVWVLYRIFKEYGIHIKSPWKIVSFKFNFYAFIYQVQQWFINYFDRFLLLFFLPLSSVGVYDFGIKCLVVLDLLLNGLHGTIYPRIIKRLNAQKEKKSSLEINRYYYGLTSVIMLIICLSIFFIPIVIELFVKQSAYAHSVEYLPYLALIYIFRAMRLYFSVPFSIYKYMQQLTVVIFIASATKLLLMIMLIEKYGIYGTIISAYISSLIEIILLWYVIRKKYQMDFNYFKLVLAPLMLLVLVLFIEPTIGQKFPTEAHLGYGIFCAGMLLMAYRNEWKFLSTLSK